MSDTRYKDGYVCVNTCGGMWWTSVLHAPSRCPRCGARVLPAALLFRYTAKPRHWSNLWLGGTAREMIGVKR